MVAKNIYSSVTMSTTYIVHTVYSITIQCTVLPYIVQYYHTVYSIIIHCTVLPYSVQYYHTVYSITIQCTVLPYSVQYYHTLYSITIQCTVLPYSVQYYHTVYSITITFTLLQQCPLHTLYSIIIQCNSSSFHWLVRNDVQNLINLKIFFIHMWFFSQCIKLILELWMRESDGRSEYLTLLCSSTFQTSRHRLELLKKLTT